MRRWAAAALSGALVVAACASSDPSPSTPAAGGSDSTAPAPTDGGTVSAGGDVPRSGGTFRLGIDRPDSFDPAMASLADPVDLIVLDLLFDSLTELGPDGAAVPSLASFSADEDLRTWTFELDGRSFAGGRQVVARDVKTSLERIIARGAASPAALRLESLVGWTDLVEGRLNEVSGIAVIDEQTVRLELTEPLATLPELLSSPIYAIVAVETLVGPQAAVDPKPVGSGKFLVSNPETDLFRLTPRDDADVYVDAIELRFHDTAAEAYDAFDSGDLDWAAVPPERIGDASVRYGADGFDPFHGLLYLGFNTSLPVFAKPGFREAIARAIDRQAIVAAVYGGTARPLEQLVPPGLLGSAVDPCADVCDHDAEAAAQLIDFVFPDGEVPTVRLDVDDSDRMIALAALIEDDLETAGIPVEVESRPFEQYQEFAASGDQELFVFGWVALGGSADFTLDPLFRSDSLDNVTSFVVPDIDFLLGAARTEPDAGQRASTLADVERLVAQKVAVAPLAQFLSLSVHSERVRDVTVGVDGTFPVGDVWLASGG